MWRPVLSQKVVKNAVLFGSLRLFQDPIWRMGKDPQELQAVGQQVVQIMALYMNSDNLIIGIPAADHHVQLLELEGKPDDEGLHTLKQIMESREGHFVQIKRIA